MSPRVQVCLCPCPLAKLNPHLAPDSFSIALSGRFPTHNADHLFRCLVSSPEMTAWAPIEDPNVFKTSGHGTGVAAAPNLHVILHRPPDLQVIACNHPKGTDGLARAHVVEPLHVVTSGSPQSRPKPNLK
ncbi:hypothetical protein C8N36_103344 [Pelagimonas varians]|uniref:Uncharacterized protein n=1 Tax=Pelagimonas varians TaxID=696760 RepID=A0A238KTE3_9RHOB|nr:hypothetical protein C8N36_103344 [Pelagimonas varians]SMX46083.1 hypothetical protein PEV8663_03188 [Pelagimonas varians]